MVHSGSVGLGHAIGGYLMDRAREIFPAGIKAPQGGFFPLPVRGPRAEEGLFYLDGMGNAANFAFANRLFLGLMAVRAIEEASGRSIASKLVYDAPHNLVFRDGDTCLHRKGATPAHGPTDTDWLGKPVIIPGSMGASSYLLAGSGNEAALESACHGAGRALSRGRAAHASRERFVEATARVMEEAPYAYKAVEPVVDSVEEAGIARKVARLWPLCTVKG